MNASNKSTIASVATLALILVSGCAIFRETPPAQNGKTGESPSPAPQEVAPVKEVKASYYGEGDGFAGKKTASGEKFNPQDLTAAHPNLPFGTKLEVVNPENGKAVKVRVNDRGPKVKGRGLDLSAAAAKKLAIQGKGVSKVEVKVVEKPHSADTTVD